MAVAVCICLGERHWQHQSIRVSPLHVQSQKDGFLLMHKLSGIGDIERLEYLVHSTERDLKPVQTSDHALIALLYPAMLSGRALHFEGVVTDQLLFQIRHDVMPLLAARDERLQPIEITAAGQTPAAAGAAASDVGTGYSAGVDSFATLQLYSEAHAPASHRISHIALFQNTQTATGGFLDGMVARAEDYSALKGLPLSKVSSNIEAVISAVETLGRAESYRQSHSLRSAASASCLASGLRRYVFSGSYDYRLVTVAQTVDVAYVDPMLMPLLSTAAFEFVSGCAGMRRFDKTLLVADNAEAWKHLHVCIRRTGAADSQTKGRGRADFINCSSCWKCVRTIFTLELEGKLERFGAVFDLALFERSRKDVVKNLRHRAKMGDGQAVDVLAYAETKGGLNAFYARKLQLGS